MDNAKKDSEGFLKVKGKGLKSLPILKNSTHTGNAIPEVIADLIDLMYTGRSLTYLHLIILKIGTMHKDTD